MPTNINIRRANSAGAEETKDNMVTGMKILPLALIIGAVALAGCEKSKKSNRPYYDGIQFKVTAKPVDKKVTLAVFTVEVKEAGLSYDGARQAAQHAGVSYCLTKAGYGTSDISWDIDPMDPESQLRLTDGAAVFQGTCAS